MMIACPYCGPRPHQEFTYGADAERQRPADPASTPDEEWFAYVYLRNNPRGSHREFWHHSFGCEAWIVVERDTLTHRIGSTAPAAGARELR
jgi:sarcosine oxidase subunit delta